MTSVGFPLSKVLPAAIATKAPLLTAPSRRLDGWRARLTELTPRFDGPVPDAHVDDFRAVVAAYLIERSDIVGRRRVTRCRPFGTDDLTGISLTLNATPAVPPPYAVSTAVRAIVRHLANRAADVRAVSMKSSGGLSFRWSHSGDRRTKLGRSDG
jgi:hypothetical protein